MNTYQVIMIILTVLGLLVTMSGFVITLLIQLINAKK